MPHSDSVSPANSAAASREQGGVTVAVRSHTPRLEPTRECESITHTRRLQALSKANEIRAAQAQLKTELATGTTQIRGVLMHPPDYAANLQVSKLLRAL